MIRRIISLLALMAIVVSANAQNLSFKVQANEAKISLTGATGMTALQFNLHLPEGVTVDTNNAILGSATDGHTLCIETLDNGDLLFILYSMDLGTFMDGELLRIPINGVQAGNANLYAIRYASADAVSHEAGGLGTLSCEDVTLTAGGETVYLEVMLTTNNVEAISGIQFNFDLPQGVTIALDEDEELDVSFPIAKKAHNCGIMNTDAGGYLVYLGGDNSLTYKATTNPVAKIGLTAKKEDVADGKYIINFVKAAMSDKSDPVQSFDVPDFKATLTIITLKGDLNGDSKVDIADAVTVLNIMAAGGYEAKADLNDDQKIDVADFVTVLNIMAAN